MCLVSFGWGFCPLEMDGGWHLKNRDRSDFREDISELPNYKKSGLVICADEWEQLKSL